MKEKSKFKLTFTDIDSKSNLNPYEIVFLVPFDTWNDFGYKIRCKVKLRHPIIDKPFYFECYIGFLPPNKETKEGTHEKFFHTKGRSLSDMIDYIEDLEASGSINELRFFTMLPSMAAYREAVDKLGPKILQDVLASINDLVYYKDVNSTWFNEALESEAFNLGFMRNSEPFYAFNNADSILNGVEDELFDGISKKLRLSYKLEGFENQHELNLNYEQSGFIPKRINILIGKNGIGKSQALKYFCRAALRYPDKNVSLGVGATNSRPMINRLLAIGTPGETQNTFPAERRSTQKLYYRRLSLTRNSKTKTSKSITDMLIQLVRSEDDIGASSRWSLFLNAISKVLPLENVAIKTKNNNYIKLQELSANSGEQATLERWAGVNRKVEPILLFSNEPHAMSSGQLTFFKFAILCCLYIENGSFVLLDEPETHMHPNMISDFVELIDEILENTGSLALIATHSAYFVREVSREQVHVLSKQNNSINISTPRLRTFGADIESISQFIFNEDIDNRLADKIFNKVKNMPYEKVQEELSSELSMSAMLNLKLRMNA
ncbi:AAA family ATPase [Aeromonas veronii]|uniref:AAA family ATPase n=1 Tax=Aeromonas veronii TaxID=654 RepID=UPI00214EA589|nr:AAA family ATPase [Aeromonas veronii]MCR3957855.1 AAA family ATPase [Aeromonas veronii]